MTETPSTGAAKGEWARHWPMVAAAMVGMSFYSVITYSLGTFIEPIEREFGWSRAEISFGLTIFAFISMLGGPFMGAALDRFGTRRIALYGMILISAAFASLGLANGSIMQWYALFAIYGVVALATKSTTWSAGVSSVFTTGRSMALAVMLSGTAIAQTLAPLLADRLIASEGWRGAYVWLGVGWGGFAAVLVALFFFDARNAGRKQGAVQAQPAALAGLSKAQATRDSRIIRIAIANLLMATVGAGVSVHLVPIIAESGLTRADAVQVAATAGIAGIVGKLGAGFLLDRFQGSLVPFSAFAIAAVGHVLLLDILDSTAALTVAAMALGISGGAGLQVTTYLVSRYAGLKNFGTIMGTIASMMMAGTAIGPVLAGLVHDKAGSYAPLLMTAAPGMVLAALLFVGLGPYPTFKEET